MHPSWARKYSSIRVSLGAHFRLAGLVGQVVRFCAWIPWENLLQLAAHFANKKPSERLREHAAKTISKRAQNDLIMSEKYARRATERTNERAQLYLPVSGRTCICI